MNPININVLIDAKKARGFTLIELTMVLFIISLLLGGLLVPLATQIESRQRNETLEQLERIQEALIGFAIINGRFPCYTSETDPLSEFYGIEDSANPDKSCNPTARTEDGILPWKTLGVREIDPWGITRINQADPWVGYWRYRVDSRFFIAFTLNTDFSSPSEQISVVEVDVNGTPLMLNSATERPVVIVYSTGANQTADGHNGSYEQIITDNPTYQSGPVRGNFDDLIIWITRPLLFSRMVTAGRLP